VVVGAGPFRGWLGALVRAVDRGDRDTVRWIEETTGITLGSWRPAPGLASRVGFTGHIDHHFAPLILAGVDALVVPSVLAEAFGLVLAEGAATGALPLAARQSGLGEAAEKLERAVGRPGMFSFAPEPDPSAAIAEGLRRLLGIPDEERRVLVEAMRGFAKKEWSWARTAQGILSAATHR
jgi:glycosyltransferase involved in cell wall biosynthesis